MAVLRVRESHAGRKGLGDKEPVIAGIRTQRPGDPLQLHHLGDERIALVEFIVQPAGQGVDRTDKSEVDRDPVRAELGGTRLASLKDGAGLTALRHVQIAALVDLVDDRLRPAQRDRGKLRQRRIQRLVGFCALRRDLGRVGVVARRRDIESMSDGAAFEAEGLYRGEQIVRDIDDGGDALRLPFALPRARIA